MGIAEDKAAEAKKAEDAERAETEARIKKLRDEAEQKLDQDWNKD
jgi:hypothetical protein